MNKKKFLTALLLVSILLAGQAVKPTFAASVLYADPSATFSDCLSWASACSLQYALYQASVVGAYQIWVKQGTYYPPGRSTSFELQNGVTLYGGFAGTGNTRNPSVYTSVLSGAIGGSSSGDNAYHVIDGNGTDSSAGIDGFLVTGGNANGSFPNSGGGGMYIYGGSPTIRNVTFSGNSALYGGGILIYNASPIISNVTFSGNTARFGGAVYSVSSSPTLINVTINGNSASVGDLPRYGGGMYNYGGVPKLLNVTLSGNSATSGGGGIYNVSSNPNIYDSIIWSGGLTNGAISKIATDGSQVWGDNSKIIGPSTSYLHVFNSDITGGCPTGAYCVSVINSDPLLNPLAQNGGFTKSMALSAGSPAINTGNNSTCAAKDQRGITRPQGIRCDMGAFEAFPYSSFQSNGAQDGWVLESAMNSNVGGLINSTDSELSLGSDGLNRQYRSILSFNTESLPDTAVIKSIQLKFKFDSMIPSNVDAISLLGGISVDVRRGFFGTTPNLQIGDFQAPSNSTTGRFYPVKDANGFYRINLSSTTFSSINKTIANGGFTQFRLRFTLKSSFRYNTNVLNIYSGNVISSARPSLTISYTP